MKHRRVLSFVLPLFAVIGVACSPMSRGVGQTVQAGAADDRVVDSHRRVERTIVREQPWESICGSDFCAIGSLFRVKAATPNSVQRVDVVATVTLDYKTSRGDWGEATLFYSSTGKPPFKAMRARFPLMSPSHRLTTSTTLSWAVGQLKASGRDYTFEFEVYPHDGNGNNRATVSGTKLTVVIEMWSAGP